MTTQQVARIILSQLGGNKFIAITGAHSFTSAPDTLSMRLKSNPKRVTGLYIRLDADDTYTMASVKLAGSFAKGNLRTVEPYRKSGLYAYNLAAAFTEATGLYTSL